MLLLLPPLQDCLLGHLWVGAAQIELPVAISINANVTLASVQWQKSCPLCQIVCFEFVISLLPCESTDGMANAHHAHAQHWGHASDIGPGQCQTMLTGLQQTIQDSSGQPVKMHQQPAPTAVTVHT